jgi:hypothetical protein
VLSTTCLLCYAAAVMNTKSRHPAWARCAVTAAPEAACFIVGHHVQLWQVWLLHDVIQEHRTHLRTPSMHPIMKARAACCSCLGH